jgi:hypothetical protein
MSDQGDAGQWRPATSQSDQYSTPDDTTGPLPAVPGDEDDAPGFPSVSDPSESWSAADDDESPTGGFPAVTPEEPAAPVGRSPFEPVNRTTFSAEEPSSPPEPEDPGPGGTTPRFGTGVRDAEDESSFGSGSFGESFREPGGSSSGSGESSFGSFGSGSFGTSSYGDSSHDSGGSGLGSSSFDSFGSGSFGSSSFDDKPFEDKPYDDKPYDDRPFEDRPYDDKPYGARESSYGPGSFTSERDETGATGTGAFEVPPRPPAPEKGVTAEDEAAENDFFASDDHPPMWDKVVAPSGPPPKPGKPSSGNLRLPDWMRDENGNPTGPPDGRGGMTHEEDGHSRRPLYLGLGVLVAGLIAVAGVYVLKGNGDSQASNAGAPTRTTQAPSQTPTQATTDKPLPRKQLPRFKGVHTKAVGRVTDPRSGLSYPRLSKPWAPAPKKSPMNELGFSVSQFAVTEKSGPRPNHWARLMSAELSGAAADTYNGPGSERDATAEAAQVYEARMFNFQHKKRLLASEPLNLGGHKGWLVSDYVTYRRPGTKATGDVVTVALIDTGKKAPGVLFMSVPNTNRKLWPDVNFIVRSLRVG